MPILPTKVKAKASLQQRNANYACSADSPNRRSAAMRTFSRRSASDVSLPATEAVDDEEEGPPLPTVSPSPVNKPAHIEPQYGQQGFIQMERTGAAYQRKGSK